MPTIQEESYSVCRDSELLRMHYEEIALHKSIPLNPDYARYDALENSGNLACFTARDADKLVGYSVFILSWHLHYNTMRVAANDVLFLHPDYRRGTAALRLIRFSESRLAERGVDLITWHIKNKRDFSPMLYRMGYVDEEKIVGKMLTRGDHGN